MKLDIKPIEGEFSVCKLVDLSKIKFNDDFFFVGKTDEELSLVCFSSSVPENVTEQSDGWRGFCVCGVLDFSMTGILSEISALLADARIAIFAVSTYNTDYILVKKENFAKSLHLLSDEGYRIV